MACLLLSGSLNKEKLHLRRGDRHGKRPDQNPGGRRRKPHLRKREKNPGEEPLRSLLRAERPERHGPVGAGVLCAPDLRHRHAGQERSGVAQARQAAVAAHQGRDHDRLRFHRHRHESHPVGGLRLHSEAVHARGAAHQGRPGPGRQGRGGAGRQRRSGDDRRDRHRRPVRSQGSRPGDRGRLRQDAGPFRHAGGGGEAAGGPAQLLRSRVDGLRHLQEAGRHVQGRHEKRRVPAEKGQEGRRQGHERRCPQAGRHRPAFFLRRGRCDHRAGICPPAGARRGGLPALRTAQEERRRPAEAAMRPASTPTSPSISRRSRPRRARTTRSAFPGRT